jgi:methionyl-tRNA formyltransferase
MTQNGPLIFAGTPAFAATHLHALLEAQLPIVAVLTQPDRPTGRGRKMQSSPVKELALKHHLPLLQPSSLKDPSLLETLRAYQPEYIICVAYGMIFPKNLLDLPVKGCLNLHASLLPRWRGAAPIQHAVWAGDSKTGVCLQQMEQGLDTGPILLQHETTIASHEHASQLYERLSQLGAQLLVKYLQKPQDYPPLPQSSQGICLAPKILKHQGFIDWSQPAESLDCQIRALSMDVGSHTFFKGHPLKIIEAFPEASSVTSPLLPGTISALKPDHIQVQTGSGFLGITCLQRPGKTPQKIAELIRTRTLFLSQGDCFEHAPPTPIRS